jgi:hypothetical protein
MDLGLGNLITLKRHLLSPAMQLQSDFDVVIADLGKGLAGQFEKFCNRSFARVASGTAEFSGDRDSVYLPRYPIESITKVETKASELTGWLEVTTQAVQQIKETSGWLYFGGMLGDWTTRVRVTYTGGYWYDTSEAETTVIPVGATALPHDLKMAWALQARITWAGVDKLGNSIARGAQKMPELAPLDLVVERLLGPHRRYVLN